MPIATLFTFDTTHKHLKEKTKFYRRLYGYADSSCYGKYFYERQGLLSSIPHIRPTESVIILKTKYSSLLRDFLKKEKVKFSEHKVILTRGEMAKL
ncbi:MAG: hypothetical protein QW818_00580 [Candidatus Aenigmatarchaeota archaeon]|nr:hypothetical protein [Candidatus Aenigmarchaeota archaeon]